MEILTIETASLGDRTYVVSDGEVAAVIDPQRDIDRILTLVNEHGLQVTDVLETHIHNDYVTGGLALCERTGATYHVNGDDPVQYERNPIRDGDELTVGAVTLRVLHTPGHTPTHLSFVAVEDGDEVAVFTGGSLLFGSVGRTDLISADRTEELTRAQHSSAQRLAELPDDTKVMPTHGFGSFCSSGDTTGDDSSTIGREKRVNQALVVEDVDEFVAQLMDGLDVYPAYYAHMGPANLAGPDAPSLEAPTLVDPAELARRIHAGEWVVDLRDRVAFAADHLTGTINVELATPASTYLGWIIPWGTPLTLIADSADEVDEMQRQLVRIGIDQLEGQHHGLPTDHKRGSYQVTDFAGLRTSVDAGDEPYVVDSRRPGEWDAGHLDFATHIPLHDLVEKATDTPSDQPVWIHCQGGYRASIGASLLARAGRDVILIDDSFDNAPDHFEVA